MENKPTEQYSWNDIAEIIREEIDAVFIVDAESNSYRAILQKGIFADMFEKSGKYHDIIEKLWFHFNNSSDAITEDYHVFVPTFGKFSGKYSKKLTLFFNGTPHAVQMMLYPLHDSDKYLIILDELDNSEYIQEFITKEKINSIQNTYLFSMYVDLIKDTTSSISVTEISDEPMNASELSYTQWRLMIVNMIFPEDQTAFLEKTAPDYLKKNLLPGRTASFDCQMQNLEGVYIWVKLIFSRVETHDEDDFRFVFMVQNIHESTVELMSTLKKYEELASKDPLTGIYNRRRTETELYKAISFKKDTQQPLSVIMIDLDHFKNVNDTYGHSAGDDVLKQLAKIAVDYLKKYNIKFGRWGGEEFLAVCLGIKLDEAVSIAEKFRLLIADTPFKTVGNFTCSIGVTEVKENEEATNAFERVDEAMYLAKSSGRNCVKIK
ncbi:MAG: GGDEF domain-containing protein [Ruminococcus sp.]|nr:GGDEF domain-containing protein [Ruminococcus sp.]